MPLGLRNLAHLLHSYHGIVHLADGEIALSLLLQLHVSWRESAGVRKATSAPVSTGNFVSGGCHQAPGTMYASARGFMAPPINAEYVYIHKCTTSACISAYESLRHVWLPERQPSDMRRLPFMMIVLAIIQALEAEKTGENEYRRRRRPPFLTHLPVPPLGLTPSSLWCRAA